MVINLEIDAKIINKQLSSPWATLAQFLVAILQWNGKAFIKIGKKFKEETLFFSFMKMIIYASVLKKREQVSLPLMNRYAHLVLETSKIFILPLKIDKKNADLKNPPKAPFSCQIALKSSLDIFYFNVTC